jgi:hypothetical protein
MQRLRSYTLLAPLEPQHQPPRLQLLCPRLTHRQPRCSALPRSSGFSVQPTIPSNASFENPARNMAEHSDDELTLSGRSRLLIAEKGLLSKHRCLLRGLASISLEKCPPSSANIKKNKSFLSLFQGAIRFSMILTLKGFSISSNYRRLEIFHRSNIRKLSSDGLPFSSN